MTPDSISRRTFLALAGTLPLAARSFAASSSIPVGLELYSVRDFLMKDLTGTVKAVAKQGYQVVEFYSSYYSWTPQQATDVRKLLDDLGIECRSTHNGPNSFTQDGISKAIELNQLIGSRYVVMASPGKVESADDWKKVAEHLDWASEKFEPLHMAAGYHNHGPEWTKFGDGQRPMDILAGHTRKDVILQLDVGTCVAAGADPVAWIKSNPGRIRCLHCKDWSPDKQYAVLFGEGTSPWKDIFAAAESTGGVEYYLIEQEAGPADEQLKRSEACLANWKKMRG